MISTKTTNAAVWATDFGIYMGGFYIFFESDWMDRACQQLVAPLVKHRKHRITISQSIFVAHRHRSSRVSTVSPVSEELEL